MLKRNTSHSIQRIIIYPFVSILMILIMVDVISIAMFVLLGSLSTVIVALLVVFFSAVCAMGFGGWVGSPLTPHLQRHRLWC